MEKETNQWHKVANGDLPTKMGHYICLVKGLYADLGWNSATWFNRQTFKEIDANAIDYWQPYPELPQDYISVCKGSKLE